jgi:hypothetical protein
MGNLVLYVISNIIRYWSNGAIRMSNSTKTKQISSGNLVCHARNVYPCIIFMKLHDWLRFKRQKKQIIDQIDIRSPLRKACKMPRVYTAKPYRRLNQIQILVIARLPNKNEKWRHAHAQCCNLDQFGNKKHIALVSRLHGTKMKSQMNLRIQIVYLLWIFKKPLRQLSYLRNQPKIHTKLICNVGELSKLTSTFRFSDTNQPVFIFQGVQRNAKHKTKQKYATLFKHLNAFIIPSCV